MTCKWCPVYVSSANGLNRVHKSGGLNFTGLHRLRFLPCRWQARSVWAAEKTWTLPFLPRATDASLLLAGKTRWAVVAVEKVNATSSPHRLVVPLAGIRYQRRTRKTWTPKFLLTVRSVCTAGIHRAPFIRHIGFIKRHKWNIFTTITLINVVNKMLLKKNQISWIKSYIF